MDSEKELLLFLLLYLEVEREVPRTLKVRGTFLFDCHSRVPLSGIQGWYNGWLFHSTQPHMDAR